MTHHCSCSLKHKWQVVTVSDMGAPVFLQDRVRGRHLTAEYDYGGGGGGGGGIVLVMLNTSPFIGSGSGGTIQF